MVSHIMVDSTSLCCDELQLAVYLYWGMDLKHCKDYPKHYFVDAWLINYISLTAQATWVIFKQLVWYHYMCMAD